MRFSKRTGWTTASNPLSQALEAKRKAGTPFIDLTESNPTRCSFNYLKPELLKPLSNPKNLIYAPDPHGLPEAREAVCGYYADKNIRITPDQVFLTASTSEAYTFLFRLLVNPRESILAPRPGYPLFDYLSGLNDAALEHYALIYNRGWRIDISSLEKAMHPKAPVLILVNPNNPTGNFVREGEREAINRHCAANEVSIVSDEVFIDFAFDEEKTQAVSFAGNESVLTFTLGGISKIMGLPQMKVSWIVVSGPRALRQTAIERLEVISDSYLSVNTPSQKALPEWLKNRQSVRHEVLDRCFGNRKYLADKLKHGKKASVLESEGGWYSIIQADSHLSDEERALRLLEKQDVLAHPGYFFDFDEGNFLVVSLLLPPALFQRGADCLSEGLALSNVEGT